MAESATNLTESRKRKFFLGANWKCNGTTAFLKEIITHMVNDFEYNPSQLGKFNLVK